MRIGIFLLSLITLTVPAFSKPYKASIVINANSGKVLSKYNADKINYPASLTKLMTIYITFDALSKGVLRKDQRLIISRKAAQQEPSNMELQAGDYITVEEALMGVVIKSANDAAVVLSEHLADSEKKFSDIMTQVAVQIGLSKTNFENASGLGDKDQICTAKDMAILALALYKHFPGYYHYFSKRTFSYKDKKFYTHNNILKMYPGADGIKTGYIAAAGFNLIASAEKDNERLIAVILGGETAEERDNEMIKLLDNGFMQLTGKKIDNYGIQLAAFKEKEPALEVIKDYPGIGKIEKKGDFFVARLVGLTKEIADKKCDRLKEQNKDCFVFQE